MANAQIFDITSGMKITQNYDSLPLKIFRMMEIDYFLLL